MHRRSSAQEIIEARFSFFSFVFIVAPSILATKSVEPAAGRYAFHGEYRRMTGSTDRSINAKQRRCSMLRRRRNFNIVKRINAAMRAPIATNT